MLYTVSTEGIDWNDPVEALEADEMDALVSMLRKNWPNAKIEITPED